MDNAVTCIANCIKWLPRVVMVWVALAAMYLQINALPSQIPPSLTYGMMQVKTIEDLLQFLDQQAKQVIPGQDKNFGWEFLEEKLDSGVTDDEDEDDDDDDGDDDHDGDDSGSDGRHKPVPSVLSDHGPSKTKLTPVQFSDVAPLPGCIPRETVVQVLPDASESQVMYWPGCVTVKRCGGCCNSDLHECQPTRSEIIQVKVVRMEYTPRASRFFHYDGVVAKNMTNHTECSCQCKIKPEDCDPATQVHNNCQCQCRKFVTCPAGKRWDPIRCQCLCSASQQERGCLRRQEWNQDSCTCTCRKDLVASCRAPYWFNYRRCRCQRRST
ncbi:vascular endothelial growth factor A-like isoform X2 [Patiria miniata]|uniref:Platelet-derived growth factor (PDGF) family profile domain-containing protein n=1 Tax=Patiria miniata TaxID=46514 RepID=A0A913ZYN6_PATMI|nr:vascular endothelial growth factor A-like isoform X2 [Patiria miniata]